MPGIHLLRAGHMSLGRVLAKDAGEEVIAASSLFSEGPRFKHIKLNLNHNCSPGGFKLTFSSIQKTHKSSSSKKAPIS